MNKKAAIPVLLLTIFIDLLGFGLVIPILPNYTKEIGVSDWMIGLIPFVYSLAQFFTNSFWGSLSDRIGRRPVLLISTLISAVGYLMFGFATSFGILIIARIISGLGSGNIGAAQAYIADVTPPEKRAKSMGLIGAAFGLGFMLGPPIGGLIKSHYGIQYVGFVTSGLCAFNFILSFFILPETLKEKKPFTNFHWNPLPVIWNGLFDKGKNNIYFLNFIYIIAFFMFQITATLIWKDKYKMGDDDIGYTMAFIGVCTTITQAGLIGWFSKKFSEIRLLNMGTILLMICLISIVFVPDNLFVPLEYMILAALSVANGMIGPTSLAIISKLTGPQEQGKAIGVFQSFGALARAIGPLIATPLYALNWNLPYLVGAGFLFINVVIIYQLSGSLNQVPKGDMLKE